MRWESLGSVGSILVCLCFENGWFGTMPAEIVIETVNFVVGLPLDPEINPTEGRFGFLVLG